MKSTIKSHQAGFAVVEIVLVVFILAAVAGVGYWVYQQRTGTAADNSPSSQTVLSDKDRAKQLSEAAKNDAVEEDKIITDSDKSDAEQAASDAASASQTGDTINASGI